MAGWKKRLLQSTSITTDELQDIISILDDMVFDESYMKNFRTTIKTKNNHEIYWLYDLIKNKNFKTPELKKEFAKITFEKLLSNINPNPGYTMNFISMNAISAFATQLNMLLSSQMNHHT